jgi:hypothetical protein
MLQYSYTTDAYTATVASGWNSPYYTASAVFIYREPQTNQVWPGDVPFQKTAGHTARMRLPFNTVSNKLNARSVPPCSLELSTASPYP